MIEVEAIRAHIPVCQRAIYMNTGWSGPSPTPVLDAIRRQLELESSEGPASPGVLAVHHEIDAQARAEVAALLGASVEEITLLENTTEGLNVVLDGLDWAPGDEAVTFGLEHSSVLVPTLFLERRGVRVKVLDLAPNEGAESILDRLRGAIGRRTRLVALSHVQYASGLRMPLEAICSLAQPLGVQVLVDGAQAAGQMPIDLGALAVDYYAMPGQKWLLGPDGTGALYVRRDRIAGLKPRKVAYRAGRYDRAGGRLEEQPDAVAKFELTTSSMALRAGLAEAVRFIQAAGVGEIEAWNRGLAGLLKEGLYDIPGATLLSPTDSEVSTGLVSVRLADLAPREAVDGLWGRWRIAARSIQELGAVRFSLHLFNTEHEVEQVLAAVGQLVREAG